MANRLLQRCTSLWNLECAMELSILNMILILKRRKPVSSTQCWFLIHGLLLLRWESREWRISNMFHPLHLRYRNSFKKLVVVMRPPERPYDINSLARSPSLRTMSSGNKLSGQHAAFTSAPASRRGFVAASLWYSQAAYNAVEPSVSLVLTSAPAPKRSRIAASLPLVQATCDGVLPMLFLQSLTLATWGSVWRGRCMRRGEEVRTPKKGDSMHVQPRFPNAN
jgi:hypothetical protein